MFKKLKLVVFSGAGMSAESGISTFRDSNGLWEQYSIEEVATPEAWNKNPQLVQDFYNLRRKQIIDAQPNEAHTIIQQLESFGKVTVITQNIDDLHERAGSSIVIHLHGNIRFAKSSGPDQEKEYYPIKGWELTTDDKCPEGFVLRPHVVWFGEDVPMYEIALKEIAMADVLIVIGTSLQVYPAAGLIHYASANCLKIIVDPNIDELNLPSDFIAYKEKATLGMRKSFELIQKKSDHF
jgi:NAD-dependent deacetylase